MTIRRPFVLVFVSLLVGCSETRTYEIAVRNQTTEPIVAWLTKDGPEYERGWKAPEDIAIEQPAHGEQIPGVMIDPGKTAYTGKVQGKFANGAHAILRVYEGPKTFHEVLAISRSSPDRLDIPLEQGRTRFIIGRDGERLVFDREHSDKE